MLRPRQIWTEGCLDICTHTRMNQFTHPHTPKWHCCDCLPYCTQAPQQNCRLFKIKSVANDLLAKEQNIVAKQENANQYLFVYPQSFQMLFSLVSCKILIFSVDSLPHNPEF